MTDFLMLQDLDRAARAKQMVMAYPYYSDEMRAAWLDAIDGMLDTRRIAMENAKQALDEAFKDYKPCK